MKQQPEVYITTLPNGIRWVHRPETGKVGHCGFVMDVGSRDETADQAGIMHFIEHMLFKGTDKRRSIHILNRMEVVGGELNAYTTKEKTVVYASFLAAYLSRGVELLSDIIFNSTFPGKELEKELKVVGEEIDMCKDSPEESIFDDIYELVFGKHPLGMNILGTKKTLSTFKPDTLKQYKQRHFTPSRLIFCTSGPYSQKAIEKMVIRYVGSTELQETPYKRSLFDTRAPESRIEKKAISQAHLMMGTLAYSLHDERRVPLMLLTNYLGGPGMNSSLSLSIREKYGLAYSIEAGYTPFQETGIFNIYAGTDKKQVDKTRSLIWKELKLMREKPLSRLRLHQIKEQFKGQIALAEESKLSLMLTMGMSLSDFDRIDTLEQVFAKIDAVDGGLIQDIAKEIFRPENMSELLYQPK